MQETVQESYHIEIDAETGREGQADENIKIYQVDAPDSFKKRNQKNGVDAAAPVRHNEPKHHMI